jgi:ABC-2 type transport system ATP-binding protein
MAAVATENVVMTRGLGRRFGSRWVVRGLELEIPRGCVYGFLGLNGAGKSTTMRMLMGLLTPHEGTMEVLGLDPVRDAVAVKRRVGFVPEKPWFYDWMTVREVMAFAAHYRPAEWDDALAERLVEVFRLPRDQRVKTLSKGQAAKLSLLLAMAFRPELLVLDEPTGGLDPAARREFLENLLAEYMEGDRTVVISSHLVNEIAGLVDRVGILHDGRMIKQCPTEDLFRTVKGATLVFDGEAPAQLAVPGVVRRRVQGRTMRLTIDGFDPVATPAALAATGATAVTIEELNLETVFIELTNDTAGGQ